MAAYTSFALSDPDRRHFLQLLAAGTVTALTSASAQTPSPMTQKSDGMNYAPQGKPHPVVKPGEFIFAAAYLEHGHIYGQCNGLLEAGAELKWVYDADPKKVEAFRTKFPTV